MWAKSIKFKSKRAFPFSKVKTQKSCLVIDNINNKTVIIAKCALRLKIELFCPTAGASANEASTSRLLISDLTAPRLGGDSSSLSPASNQGFKWGGELWVNTFRGYRWCEHVLWIWESCMRAAEWPLTRLTPPNLSWKEVNEAYWGEGH